MNTSHSPQNNEEEVVHLSSQERGTVMDAHEKQGTGYDPGASGHELQGRAKEPTVMPDLVDELIKRNYLANVDGRFADEAVMRKASAELSRLRAERDELAKLRDDLSGALNTMIEWRIKNDPAYASDVGSLLSQVSP